MRSAIVVVVGSIVLVGNAAVAAPPAPREAEVKAVYYTVQEGTPRGGTTKVAVRLSPNKARVPSVGVMEEFAGGTGNQWRTALWQAAFVATQATGTSLLNYEFLLRVGGHIDGPSAGLLTAATLTALIKNKKLLPATTMTGTINPDGSSGPVGGIEYKMRGAAADGIKRFGFPIGARHQLNSQTGNTTDLLGVAQELGIEAKELRNLDDAYLFLTGDTLGRPVAASESDMELAPDEVSKYSTMKDRIRAELSAALPDLELALKKIDPGMAGVLKKFVMERATAADRANESGDAVRALTEAAGALARVRNVTVDARLQAAFREGDGDTIKAILDRLETAVPLQGESLRKEIASQFPPTSRLNDIWAMDVLESHVGEQGAILTAQIKKSQLTELLKPNRKLTPDEAKQTLKRLREYAGELQSVLEEYESGRRYMSIYASMPPLKRVTPSIDAQSYSSTYVSAGSASRAYFEALVTEPAAQSAGISQSQAQGYLIEKDRMYLDLMAYGRTLESEKDGRARLLAAFRQTIYAAYLVNTYYALGGQRDAKGVLSLRNPRALTAQLELARQRSLESCGRAAREFGHIPLPSRFRYQLAAQRREGTDEEKADALANLWIANWWCEFAVAPSK